MRYDGERKARTRERVLQEAAAAIRADGPDRLGVAGVMARAGLTHGGFYAHFASRDDLVSEAVGYMFAGRYDAFFSDCDDAEPRDALRRLVEFYLSMQHRDARDTGCPIPILSGELGRLPKAAQHRFAQAVDRLTQGVARLLARAGVDDAQNRALSAIAEMVGAVALARTRTDRGDAEALLAAARASVERKFDLT